MFDIENIPLFSFLRKSLIILQIWEIKFSLLNFIQISYVLITPSPILKLLQFYSYG